MQIQNLFERDIFRPINGVVKADQLDESSVWQELDEFVITRELDQHVRKFISWYLEAVEQGKNPDPAGKMGVWMSGFFGSGKSHFLKVLSYRLRDHPHIAHLERYLDGKDKLQAFHDAYRKHTGLEWVRERDAYQFNRDEVVKALCETLGQSQAAAEKWIDGAEDNFSLTIENFCKW